MYAQASIAAILLTAILANAAAAQSVSVTDTTGVEITLPAPATRVVTVDNAAYIAVTNLDVLPVGAAVNDDARNNDANHPDGESVPNVGVDPWTPDGELVARVEPDLVVGWVDDHRPMLEAIAPYYAFAGLGSLDSYFEAFRDLGVLLGRHDRAEQIIATFETRAAAYAALVTDRPTVMGLWGDVDAGTFWIDHTAYPGCQVIARVVPCPWQNPAGDNGGYQAGLETILSLDPDVILLANWPVEETLAKLQQNPLWNELRAVKDGRVYTPQSATAWSTDSVAGFSTYLDNTIPLIFPQTFPNGPLTDEEVAAVAAGK